MGVLFSSPLPDSGGVNLGASALLETNPRLEARPIRCLEELEGWYAHHLRSKGGGRGAGGVAIDARGRGRRPLLPRHDEAEAASTPPGPRVLLCHDLAGNYRQDRHAAGCRSAAALSHPPSDTAAADNEGGAESGGDGPSAAPDDDGPLSGAIDGGGSHGGGAGSEPDSPPPAAEWFTFNKWASVDMFVYFAHAFAAVPPLGWCVPSPPHTCMHLYLSIST